MGGRQLGAPAGILKIENVLLSTPMKARAAFGFTKSTYLIDRLDFTASLEIDHQTYPLDGLNTRLSDDEAILFTPEFANTTKSPLGGSEYIMTPTGAIFPSAGGFNSLIPKEGFIYSVGKNLNLNLPTSYKEAAYHISLIPLFHPDNSLTWNAFENIIGGTPLLILDGKINPHMRAEKILESFIVKRHARSAVAIKEDGTLFFVATEATGYSLDVFAEILVKLGAFHAMNLDGGGSSSLYVNGTIVNRGATIPVGNMILIFSP